MIKDKVLEILYQLGFQPELIDESFGYRFEYEGLTMLLMNEDEESHTVSFMIPAIFEITEENRTAVMEAAVRLSSKMKFVQSNLIAEAIWLNYQHYLGEKEPESSIIEHMIRVLAISTMQFHKIINNEDDEELGFS